MAKKLKPSVLCLDANPVAHPAPKKTYNNNNKKNNIVFLRFYTIIGYLMPNLFYTYIFDIYDLVGLGLWHINYCWLFNAKSYLYIYVVHSITFQTFFVQAFKIVVDSWKFTMLLL